MSHTLLTRLSLHPSVQTGHFSSLQAEVDGLVTHFTEEAANPITLASLMAGGMAYRWGRIGVMGYGSRVMGVSLRLASYGFGLGSEVTTFEFTSRALRTFPSPITHHPSPNLWNWSGHGGWQQGLLSSLITFGLLRGAGSLAHEQNLVFQHAFQSTAMVAGHQATGLLQITPRQKGSLAEQFLNAEVMNLQMGAGLSLLHSVAPGIAAWERGLDVSSRTAAQEGIVFPTSEGMESLTQPLLAEGVRPPRGPRSIPTLLAMSANESRGGGSHPSEPIRSETFIESLKLFRREMGRMIDRHIDQHRSRWLGVLIPAGVTLSDLVPRAIRNSELFFGEKTLRVILLKNEEMPEPPLLKALHEEFGADQVGSVQKESLRQKRIIITTPTLLSQNLRAFGKEKSTLILLENASEIDSPSIRSLITHFGFAQAGGSGPLRSKRGNGMVIGFSDSQEGLGGFLLSSPKELPHILPRISPPPPQEGAPPSPALRASSPSLPAGTASSEERNKEMDFSKPPVNTETRPATSVTVREPFRRRERILIPPPRGPESPEVKVPPPTAVPPPVRPVWPPSVNPSPPSPAQPVWPPSPPDDPPLRSVWDPSRPTETTGEASPKKRGTQAVAIRSTPTVTEDIQKRIDAFWKALHEARAQEAEGKTINPFKVGQRAWQIYLETLPPEEKKVLEHNYLQSLANLAPDDRIVGIVQFLSQIGVRRRKK